MRIASVQMSSQEDLAGNLEQGSELVAEAARHDVELVVLPEGCFFLGAESNRKDVAEDFPSGSELHGPMGQALGAWARRDQMWIIAGGVPERSEDPARPYNTSLVVSPSGRIVARYRKLHLFDVELSDGTSWCESRGTMPGAEPVVAEVDALKVGLSICYDLRFPGLFAWHRSQGAQLLTLPAAFTQTTGEAHWHVLCRARAIETQCYLVAAAQEGRHPPARRTYGHSLIVDPWGKVLVERTEPGPGVIWADLDQERIRDVRRSIPVDRHRRDL